MKVGSIIAVIAVVFFCGRSAHATVCKVDCKPKNGLGAFRFLDISNLTEDPNNDYKAYCNSLGGEVRERTGDRATICRSFPDKANKLACIDIYPSLPSASITSSGATVIEARKNGRATCLASLNINSDQSCEVGLYVESSIDYQYDCK